MYLEDEHRPVALRCPAPLAHVLRRPVPLGERQSGYLVSVRLRRRLRRRRRRRRRLRLNSARAGALWQAHDVLVSRFHAVDAGDLLVVEPGRLQRRLERHAVVTLEDAREREPRRCAFARRHFAARWDEVPHLSKDDRR
eukprot:scaffold121513_cov63-Phaeocystis_antarctica.AAC.2